MMSYSKWDRDSYVERVGGIEEAERRRRAVVARVDAYQLAEIRRRAGLTQAQVAEIMGVSKGRVSQIERGEVFTVEVVARYVEALGGHLKLLADFGDHTYQLSAEHPPGEVASIPSTTRQTLRRQARGLKTERRRQN